MPDVPPVVAKPFPEATIEPPPDIDTPVPIVEIPWPQMSPAEDPSKVKQPQEKKPQQARTPVVPAPPPETEPATPLVPQPPAPRLGEILPDNRRRQSEADFKRFTAGARAALRRATVSNLNDWQKLAVARIKSFLEQADKSHASDLTTALELARRADSLGGDLLKSLR